MKQVNQMAKIMLLCHVDENFKKIENLVFDNHKNYCDKHNVIYKKIYTKDILISSDLINNQVYWLKIYALYDQLINNPDIDWIFLLDIDCIFLRKTIPLDFFVSSCNNKQDILLCYMDNNIVNFWNVNIGAAFFKNTVFVKQFIRNMLDFAEQKSFSIYEQNCLQYMLQHNHMSVLDHVGFFPEHSFNHGHDNSFIFHACAESSAFSTDSLEEIIDKKCNLLRRYL